MINSYVTGSKTYIGSDIDSKKHGDYMKNNNFACSGDYIVGKDFVFGLGCSANDYHIFNEVEEFTAKTCKDIGLYHEVRNIVLKYRKTIITTQTRKECGKTIGIVKL